MGIPNPVELLATGVRVAVGIGIDVASYGADKVFPHDAGEDAPETTAAAGANVFEVADAMLDGTWINESAIAD
jgi:hypothetical protein